MTTSDSSPREHWWDIWFHRRSVFTGAITSRKLHVRLGDALDYFAGRKLVQHAFPYLTENEREFLVTGMTDEEQRAFDAIAEEEEHRHND